MEGVGKCMHLEIVEDGIWYFGLVFWFQGVKGVTVEMVIWFCDLTSASSVVQSDVLFPEMTEIVEGSVVNILTCCNLTEVQTHLLWESTDSGLHLKNKKWKNLKQTNKQGVYCAGVFFVSS